MVTKSGIVDAQAMVVPGIDPTTAVFTKSSDADGTAVFQGLERGQYRIIVRPDIHRVVLAGNVFPSMLATVPGPEVQITLGELHAAVIRFSDDEVISWEGVESKNLGRVGGVTGIGWNATREELTKKNPGALVVVWSPAWPFISEPRMTLRPFLRRRGLHPDLDVTLVPVSKLAPVSVDCSGLPLPERHPSGELLVEVRNADGGALELGSSGFQAYLNEGPHIGSKTVAVVIPGESVCVPAGDWWLVPMSQTYIRTFPPVRVSVGGGTSIHQDLTAAEQLYPIQFVARMEGEVLPDMPLLLTHAACGENTRGLIRMTNGKPVLWLGGGAWEARFLADGCEIVWTQFDVRRQDEVQSFYVDLVVSDTK